MKNKDSPPKEKVLSPFWNDYCDEINSLLLSHTQIDCADSDLKYSNSCSTKTEGKSWFSTDRRHHPNKNSQKIYLQHCTSFNTEYSNSVNTQIKTRKIRIYPTRQQKKLFKTWIGVSRKFYNESLVNYSKEEFSKFSWIDMFNKLKTDLDSDYIKNVPYQIKKIACRDCYKSLIFNKKKAKQTGKSFKTKFRSKKDVVQSCYISKEAVRTNGIYHTIAGKLHYKEKDWFENQKFSDCRLLCEHGKWYIMIPKVVITNPFDNQEGVVAVDPGIRTFSTYFSTNGRFGRIGIGSFNRILKLNLKIDKLISKISKESSKIKKRNLKRTIMRVREKIKNLVDELHWKAINFLIQNFKIIIFPPFNVSEMVSKTKRRLRKSVIRSMLSYRFYEFKRRLKQKCEENGVTFVENSEAYTSKTNSFTGEIMNNLGSKEYFKYDNLLINRDINGARNILLRAMRDTAA